MSKHEERQIVRWLRSLDIPLSPWVADIGGNATADVSAPLIDDGWTAVIVEPQEHCVRALQARFGSLPNVSIVPVACSAEEGFAELFYGAPGPGSEVATLSTRDDPWMSQVRSPDHVRVATRRLTSVLREAGFPREFGVLKIDTESWDLQVLLGLDFEEFEPSVIITEEYLWDVDGTIRKHALLEEAGYVNAGAIFYNTLWIHRGKGARAAYSINRAWLTAIDQYPTGLMGDASLTDLAYFGPDASEAAAPVDISRSRLLVDRVPETLCGETRRLDVVPVVRDPDFRPAFLAMTWFDDDGARVPVPDGREVVTFALAGLSGGLVTSLLISPDREGRFRLDVEILDSGLKQPADARMIASQYVWVEQ